MSRFILLMLSCRWYEGVFSGCLLIKWNKTNLQCLKSGWTKTSCVIQLWSIVARFRNFANDRVVHGSFLNPLIWTSDLKRCSNFLTVGGQVFLHSDALKHLSLWDIALHSRVFSTHPHLLHFSKVKMHEMLTSRLLFPSVMSESGRCDGLLIREGRKNSHLSVINKGLMKVVYQMKTAERLRDKSWGNFPSFRRRLASRQLPRLHRYILSVCVSEAALLVRVSDVIRPAASLGGFTAAWLRPADTVIAVDGSYSRTGTRFVTSSPSSSAPHNPLSLSVT